MSSPAGRPIAAAAASVNAMRPAAPARLMASKFIIVLQLPPVICAPNTGSLNFGSLEASWTRISFQFEPSSSEMICAMVEAMCWPMSALPQVTVTSPSGPIEYHALGSNCRRRPTPDRSRADRELPIAEREAGRGGAYEERTARKIGGFVLVIFACVFMSASDRQRWTVRMSAAARRIAFSMRE